MKIVNVVLLLFAAAAILGGCASHPAYYVAPTPPPVAYTQTPLIQTGQQNGYADGVRTGERDRIEGHSYRPTNGDRYANTPGYYPQLGGPFREYQSVYRDAYLRGYHHGYSHA